jgi:hypothetical protein
MRVTAAVAVASFALACSACTGDNGNASDAGGDATLEATDICSQFTDETKAGDPCPQASPTRCFPECESGGCYCAVGMGGGPAWKCTTDLSCMPDCAPIDDACP